jgi:hypothetical protein
MGKVRRSTLLGLTFLLLFVAGCKVSCTTANISSLKLSKDDAGTVQTKEFAPTDTIYARASVGNNGGTVTLKFNLIAEKVQGTPENAPVSGSEFSVDVPGDGYAVYHLRRDGGWPAGRYRVEVAMLYNGEQKDKKSDTFTVTGGTGGVAPPSPAAQTSPPGGGTSESEDNENNSENSSPHDQH